MLSVIKINKKTTTIEYIDLTEETELFPTQTYLICCYISVPPDLLLFFFSTWCVIIFLFHLILFHIFFHNKHTWSVIIFLFVVVALLLFYCYLFCFAFVVVGFVCLSFFVVVVFVVVMLFLVVVVLLVVVVILLLLLLLLFPWKLNRFQAMKETSATPRSVISRDASNRLHKERQEAW